MKKIRRICCHLLAVACVLFCLAVVASPVAAQCPGGVCRVPVATYSPAPVAYYQPSPVVAYYPGYPAVLRVSQPQPYQGGATVYYYQPAQRLDAPLLPYLVAPSYPAYPVPVSTRPVVYSTCPGGLCPLSR